VRHELERVEIPGEDASREHAWAVVEAAFAERTPVPQPSHWPRVAAVALALAALVAASLSAPGRAVIDEIREAVGVEGAERALFSIPTEGRLLVASDSGVWVVQRDGSRRLLDEYREASWSPFGRFVVAARQDELAALEPDGHVRWTLPRPQVRFPRWAGTETDTRIAYLSGRSLRVVAGDGEGDRLLRASVAAVAPAWRPGSRFELAFTDRQGRVAVVEADSGRILWRSRRGGRVLELEWSSDGRRLLVRQVGAKDDVAIYTSGGALFTGIRIPRGTVTAASGRPGSHARALALSEAGQSRLFVTGVSGTLLSGPGAFGDLAWSPDGRWLLVTWPAADQWVFVRATAAGGRRISAVANVSEQFGSVSPPRIEGWCCAR
jgi:hypothetical protein